MWSPTVVILDIGLVGMDGLTFSRVLKDRARPPFVILLTGGEVTAEAAMHAGADAVLRKPFSPFDLMTLLESVRASDSGAPQAPVLTEPAPREAEQLLAYARDLGRFVEVEHEQRQLLQNAYRETATALADALEARDPSTGRHALRVQQYAIELTTAVDEYLLEDGTLEYGYLLHDVGKIGVPDAILQKVGSLDDTERRIIEQHTVIGAKILSPIPFLRGAAVGLVRSHHECWDGSGYPDGLEGMKIPLSARIFAIVDALDAMTTDRPYRRALAMGCGRQGDPRPVRPPIRSHGRRGVRSHGTTPAADLSGTRGTGRVSLESGIQGTRIAGARGPKRPPPGNERDRGTWPAGACTQPGTAC